MNDPDSYHDTTHLITKNPDETTPHANLTTVQLDHVYPAKLAHHSSQPYSSSTSQSSNKLPKRASTTPSTFTAQEFPRAKFQFNSPLTSPGSPFSPMHMPHTNATGYNSLPDEEPD